MFSATAAEMTVPGAVKNVVVIGASYAGALLLFLPCRQPASERELTAGLFLYSPRMHAGSHAAELLATQLPKTHRVILIDKNRCVPVFLPVLCSWSPPVLPELADVRSLRAFPDGVRFLHDTQQPL